MSMFVNVVRVTPAAFETIKKDPSVLEGVFDGDAAVMKKLGIADVDSQGFDYRIADDMMDEEANLAMLDEEDNQDKTDKDSEDNDPVFKDLCADGRLDYDAGYGLAFTLSPKAVKKAVSESSSIEIDKDVKKLFKAADKRGDYIIGIIS